MPIDYCNVVYECETWAGSEVFGAGHTSTAVEALAIKREGGVPTCQVENIISFRVLEPRPS